MVRYSTLNADTYYLYNPAGQLRYVLPPSAADALVAFNFYDLSNDAISKYTYFYQYDARGNCIQKKLPACEPVLMKYDQGNRMVFSQDGERRNENQWLFILYDALGREVVKGVCPSQTFTSFENTVVKATYNGGTSLGGYSVIPALTGTIKLMTVNYYDDYAFLNMTMTANKDSLIFLGKGYDAQFTSARGNLTGTRVYQLDDPAKFTVSAIYYDHRGRIVQQHSSNHLGGYDNEYFTFTFSGKVKQRMLVHSATSSTTRVETYYYNYGNPTTNPTERLLDLKHRLSPNTAQITMAVYTYDEIGRLKTKGLATETSTYSYNVRSWLTRIEGSKFNQTLAYNAPVNGVTPSKALYNGNISAMKWKSGSETVERGYKFTYDGLDRLTAATYGEGANITSNLNNYNEAMTYNDKMGNIRTLVRRGRLDSGYGEIDNLTYTYTGNRLTKVTDAVTTPITYQGVFHFVDGTNAPEEYTYDTNGNITKDLNRNITSITYNELNLPKVITMSGNKSVTYGYDAAGRKLSVVYKSGTTTTTSRDYVGNKVYNNGTLGIVLTEEGYATVSGTPAYYYHLKDHQGNNRVVISQSGAVQEVNHYYPFGGLFGEGVQPSIQRYKYNGKELDREFGLDMYDYGARHYDAALGRWFTVDPLAEKYYSISPYVYVTNNPIRFIDPDGRDVWEINDVGKIVNRIKDKTQDAFYMVDNKGNRTYTTDADGNKSYNSISFEHGTITDSQKAGGLFFKKDATSFSVGNEASGASLFKFFADNTKIEFGLINTQSNGSTVMTNHKEGSVKASLTAQQLSDKWQTVTSIIHNHPNSTQPSGFRAGDTSGDKFAANILPNVDRYVYQPKNNALVMYDNKSIIGTMSWNMVFSPATIVAPRLRTPHTFYPGVGLPPP